MTSQHRLPDVKLLIVGEIVCLAQGHSLALLSPLYLFMAALLPSSDIILPLLASSSPDATLALRIVFTEIVFLFLFFFSTSSPLHTHLEVDKYIMNYTEEFRAIFDEIKKMIIRK